VLIVEDDPAQRRVFALVVENLGHDPVECGTMAEARAAGACEIAFVDRRLPDGDGRELARNLGGRVYLLTGEEPDAATREEFEVLVKPVRPARLETLLG
jgi:CheY-like chemotaxis protein